jgi:glycosyltransferase involved in cell wall biosynthesis
VLRCLRGFELVHFNKTHPRNSLPAIVASRLAGSRVVVATEHVATPVVSNLPLGRQIITLLIRAVNRLIDATIAVSEPTREMLIRNYGLAPSRVVTIRNGIDVSRFDAGFDRTKVRAELGLLAEDAVALFVGRMSPGKGHELALRSLKLTAGTSEGSIRLVFAGEGELLGDLRSRAAGLGVEDRVVFAGFRRDIPALLAASDMLVLPSEAESLPMVILEAMASRMPVIATDVGGISEVVLDGRTGILVHPGDAEALAAAMVRLASDPERRRAMGEAGRRRVELEFSSEASVTAVFELYGRLLDRKERAC